MSAFASDLRYARRVFLKSPVFTAAVIITLALGIGLNTAVFSAVHALLFRPLPGTVEPDRLVQLYRSYRTDFPFGSNSIPHYLDLRARTGGVFSGVAAWSYDELNLSAAGVAQRTIGAMVSANYFEVYGARAALGRTFAPEEDVGRGAHPVTVLSHGAWKTLFGGDPAVLGRSILVNGRSYRVVGVAEADFRGGMPVLTPTLWLPLMQISEVRPGSAGAFEERGSNFMNVVARLRPGVTASLARERLNGVIDQLRQEYPEAYEHSAITLVPQSEAGIHPMFGSSQLALSAVVMTVVGMLLLIACVNVANLFLARARARSREMAIRMSLGAGRAVLVRQLLVESLLFALVAGLAGLALAAGAIRLAGQVRLPFDGDFDVAMRLDPAVLIFTLTLSTFTALLFGLAPALQATRPALVPALKGETPAGAGRSRTSSALVLAQTALSIILLVCAGLFLRSLEQATAIDKGFVSEHLLIASLDPGLQGYDRPRSEQFFEQLEAELQRAPGVDVASLADHPPLGVGRSNRSVEIEGYTPAPNENLLIDYSTVRPGYFAALGIPLLRGRDYTARDDSLAPPALIINERFATRYWPGQDPIGRRVRFAGADHQVIGVVATGKYNRLGEDPMPYMYLHQAQHWQSGMTVFVRTHGDPVGVVAPLRAAVRRLDPDLPLGTVRSMQEHLAFALLPARLLGSVLALFGLLGLTLAAVGLYSVVAYSVAQRTREIGIRMAVGAARLDVTRLVLRQGLGIVAAGVIVGSAGAAAAARLVRSMLYGDDPIDPWTLAGVPALLLAVAFLAVWIPARRAARLNPVQALRQE